jgi:hypothetical protein
MRLVLKIIAWSGITIVLLLMVLFSLSLLFENKVIGIFLNSLNRDISTKIEVGSYRLSFIRKFPRASVQLENVIILSSPGFDKSHFGELNTDTLLFAKSASLEFSMTNLIRGNYNIESMSIKRGRLNLYSDSAGKVNYEISGKRTSGTDKEIDINLERINITDLNTKYINAATSLTITGLIRNGRFKSRITGNNIDFICTSSLQIFNFDLYSTNLATRASAYLDLNLHKSDSGILFKKSSLKLENFNFSLSGFVRTDNHLDLNITGRNIDLARIKKYLPEKYLAKFREYNPSGIVKTDCRIMGLLSRTSNPSITLAYSLEKGHIRYKKSSININDLSISGFYTNGKLNSPVTSRFEVSNIDARLGSAIYLGSFSIENFVHPRIDMTFSGDLIPSELMEFVSLPEISRAKGSLRLNVKLSGTLVPKKKYTLSDLIDLNPEADIRFRSFGIAFRNNKLSFDNIDGNIMFARNLWAEDLVLSLNGQRFRINGEFKNLPAWIAGKPVQVIAVTDVSAGTLKPESFMADTVSGVQSNKKPYTLPDGIDLQVAFRIDSLVYKTFSAGNITGILHYKPYIINIKSLKLNTLNGYISGEGYLAQNAGKSFNGLGSLDIKNADVNLAFRAFKNFAQNFIKAENLAGSLSGSLSFLLPFDSHLRPDMRSLTADGKYVLVNGALIDFEPVKELSKFIELSELQDIKFSKLENDLVIRNNYLSIPQMDIKSSAADFSISGKHDFDNNYEYHVKTYLSVILSRKAKRGSWFKTENGTAEEDGLGRTSIFLKITGKGEDVKVSYDLKAVGANIKQNLKNEKSTIKNILKQEYGWFKSDTTLKQERASKPKFRIEWAETDTIRLRKDTSTVGNDKLINRIFKREKE